ncbi:Uncharacterized protein HZ326_24328 [Fusarium oxysporum f. sp. albedinis]|nr:Uncharacterized protein HZ326_24328 [Fusarium oxysporum f. sp. albedinis]
MFDSSQCNQLGINQALSIALLSIDNDHDPNYHRVYRIQVRAWKLWVDGSKGSLRLEVFSKLILYEEISSPFVRFVWFFSSTAAALFVSSSSFLSSCKSRSKLFVSTAFFI